MLRLTAAQVLALAAGGASIVTYNFGQLITVRCLLGVLASRALPFRWLALQGLYCFGLCLGTLYSVPPFRLKVSMFARASAPAGELTSHDCSAFLCLLS